MCNFFNNWLSESGRDNLAEGAVSPPFLSTLTQKGQDKKGQKGTKEDIKVPEIRKKFHKMGQKGT